MLRSQRQISRDALIAIPIETRAGTFIAHFSDSGLAQLDFPRAEHEARVTPRHVDDDRTPVAEWVQLTKTALHAVLNGEKPSALPPMDLRCGTEFQQRVWQALREIPPGATKRYGEIAGALGSVNLSRAVGAACGANPIPVLIPCHRVLAGEGKIGGFSGGLEWKKRLLAVEVNATPLLR